MKENQIAAVFDSESFGGESDTLTLRSKETQELNDSRIDASPTLFEAKDRDVSSNCKIMDDLSADIENGTIDSPTKEGENGLSRHLSSWDKDADSLSSDSYDMDKEQRSPEHEDSTIVAEFAGRNGSDSRNSSSRFNGASDLFGTDANMFTDKNVLECDVPELEVCYRDIDCQILKDICVDEGRPEKDINVIESFEDEKPGHLFSQPPDDNDHFESTEESTKEHTDGLDANQCGSKKAIERNTLVSQGSFESSVDNFFEKDTTKSCDPESLGEAETGGSPEECTHVGENLPMEDCTEENEIMQPPNQILNEQADSESHDASLEEAGGTGEDLQDSSLLYKSNVETGIITFNFNSSTPVAVGSGITENVEEQSSGSRDVLNDLHTVNLSDANVQEQPLVNENSDASSVQCVRSEDTNNENTHDHQSPEDKEATKSDDLPGQIPTKKSQSPTNDDPMHQRRNSGNVSVVNQLQHDEGETSFSAASLITYSGPIAFSGSLSHRSDGSTTSAKSFAFPILQSEWNSSPVRMAKADRRHFRKHKGWRSGLLCCRF